MRALADTVFMTPNLPALLFTAIITVPSLLQAEERERLAELDAYWAGVANTIRKGDFEGYAATCHPDAVLVSERTGASYPLVKALARWKKEFEDTKAGRRESQVTFRFAQRFGDTTTAHERGIFLYSFRQGDQPLKTEYVHFEALLVKKNRKWQILMEYQKTAATEEEWKALAE